eukprot:scaffold1.g5692.t1
MAKILRHRRHRRAHLPGLLVLAVLAALAVTTVSRHALPSVAKGEGRARRRTARAAVQAPPARSKPVLLFDKGGRFYHETNMSCPVPWVRGAAPADVAGGAERDAVLSWPGRALPGRRPCAPPRPPSIQEWTTDEEAADALIWNILDNPEARGGSWRPKARRPGQKKVFLSLETGAYYPVVFNAKKQGFDLTIDYRYGTCLHNKDSPIPNPRGLGHHDRKPEKLQLSSQYLFGAAMENSDDHNYVYQALEAGTLPLYLGAADVRRFVPVPEAVVAVSDFSTLEALAAYMKELAADLEKYARHFEWKKAPFSARFREIERLAGTTAHCRLAMLLAGRPFAWREGEVGARDAGGGGGGKRRWWPW